MKTLTKKRGSIPPLTTADIERLNALGHRPAVHDDDNPPLTATQLSQAVRHRGRPRGSQKSRLTLRVDTEVAVWLRSGGPGYQTRINGILRREMAKAHVRQRVTARH